MRGAGADPPTSYDGTFFVIPIKYANFQQKISFDTRFGCDIRNGFLCHTQSLRHSTAHV